MIIGGKISRTIAVRIKDRTVGLKGKSGAGPQARLSMSIQKRNDIGVEACPDGGRSAQVPSDNIKYYIQEGKIKKIVP